MVEEFEQRLHQIHTKGLPDEQARDQQPPEDNQQQEQGWTQIRMFIFRKLILFLALPVSSAVSTDKAGIEQPPPESQEQDFTSDVLTSARKRLVSATPTTPLSLSNQKTVCKSGKWKSANRRKRLQSDSSDSELENQIPATKLELDCSSDSDFQ